LIGVSKDANIMLKNSGRWIRRGKSMSSNRQAIASSVFSTRVER
jgi:hypothetical protein